MQKNEILNSIIKSLLAQRDELINEFKYVNYNETNHIEKKMALETAIFNIDMQIQNHVINCTL